MNTIKAYEEAKIAIANSSEKSSVYIGCDSIRFKSKRKGQWKVRFSTVIILHHDSCHGGKIFYNTIVNDEHSSNLKMRLLNEVQLAVDAAMAIIDVIGNRKLEIHLDINPDVNHKSSIAVKEALGWVKGMGFDAKIKPESFAATHAADHCVRNLN